MKVGVSMGIFGKEWEFYCGKAEAQYGLVELSGTILTAKVALYIRV